MNRRTAIKMAACGTISLAAAACQLPAKPPVTPYLVWVNAGTYWRCEDDLCRVLAASPDEACQKVRSHLKLGETAHVCVDGTDAPAVIVNAGRAGPDMDKLYGIFLKGKVGWHRYPEEAMLYVRASGGTDAREIVRGLFGPDASHVIYVGEYHDLGVI